MIITSLNLVLRYSVFKKNFQLNNIGNPVFNIGNPVFNIKTFFTNSMSVFNILEFIIIANIVSKIKKQSKTGSSFLFNKNVNPVQGKKNQFDEIKELNVYYLSLAIYFLLPSRRSSRCLPKVALPFFSNKIGSPVFVKILPLMDTTFYIKNILSFKINKLFLTNKTKKRIILWRMKCRKKSCNIFSKHPNNTKCKITRHTTFVYLRLNNNSIANIKTLLLNNTYSNSIVDAERRKGKLLDYAQLYFFGVATFSCNGLARYRVKLYAVVKLKSVYFIKMLKIINGNRNQISIPPDYLEQGTFETDNHKPYPVSIGNLHIVRSPPLKTITLSPIKVYSLIISNE